MNTCSLAAKRELCQQHTMCHSWDLTHQRPSQRWRRILSRAVEENFYWALSKQSSLSRFLHNNIMNGSLFLLSFSGSLPLSPVLDSCLVAYLRQQMGEKNRLHTCSCRLISNTLDCLAGWEQTSTVRRRRRPLHFTVITCCSVEQHSERSIRWASQDTADFQAQHTAKKLIYFQ